MNTIAFDLAQRIRQHYLADSDAGVTRVRDDLVTVESPSGRRVDLRIADAGVSFSAYGADGTALVLNDEMGLNLWVIARRASKFV